MMSIKGMTNVLLVWYSSIIFLSDLDIENWLWKGTNHKQNQHFFLEFLGAWMTLKKAEMENTLRNWLSLSEMEALNHKWLDFTI